MASYSEKEFPYARPVAEALISDPAFRTWFLRNTPYEAVAASAVCLWEEQRALGSTPASRERFWFNLWCPKDRACMCRGEATGIETDILLLFRLPDTKRLALHIEVKRPRDILRPDQEEAYGRRAVCWTNPATRPRTVPAHDLALTALVCDTALAAGPRAARFDRVVTHEELETLIPPYPHAG